MSTQKRLCTKDQIAEYYDLVDQFGKNYADSQYVFLCELKKNSIKLKLNVNPLTGLDDNAGATIFGEPTFQEESSSSFSKPTTNDSSSPLASSDAKPSSSFNSAASSAVDDTNVTNSTDNTCASLTPAATDSA
ncbi:unnamed protein product [Phytophthora lilii]|uniref:Unnamed protein product n=1 Tax=Phytophthora lilii TaxID=2077276 RepID=A0A9W6YHQ8_9STRA|nr:unnamed protein product [Phytophthora lilii]